jgi:DNA (cytosine-5)-methyltransferase 1
MKYGSVCSGIEAATVAWHPLGWEAQWLAEVEPFPSAVLAHHYPNTPNMGDMTKFKEWPDATLDVLVGGTPCQSFSVAGLRKGLDDPRGNLMLTYLAIAVKYRPKWVVWENVPGVLSSNGGRDFATFFRGLEECGYGVAYRILDAQYFGVAQRRRRVFVVGCLGSWQRAAAVLFERDSLCGNPAPSREKRQKTTGNVAIGVDEECNATIEGFSPLLRGGQGGTRQAVAYGVGEKPEVAHCLRSGASKADKHESTTYVTTFDRQSSGEYGTQLMASTVSARDYKGPSDLVGVCYENHAQDARVKEIEIASLHAKAGTGGGNLPLCHFGGMQVRRLTPVECERLQGFPDGYTNIPWRNKPESPDGPRYKALGNSMAVPVMKWIGERIEAVDFARV